jgi:carboxyl-terminal processing protease
MARIILLKLILITNFLVFGQESSLRIEKLVSTCKIWGFLKYYHPAVTTGKYDWDYALIKTLGYVENAKSVKDFNKLALSSIQFLGTVEHCSTCHTQNSAWFDANFDLTWISDMKYFSSQLVEELKHIEKNRNQEKGYYAFQSMLSVDVSNEKIYADLVAGSIYFRLLELFRYWNIVEYYSPYKYQMDQDWDSVLIEMIPKFCAADDMNSYHMLLLNLIAKTNDGHSYFTSEYTNDFYLHKLVPVRTMHIENSFVVAAYWNDSLAKLDDIRVGDIITEIDGVSVKKMVADAWPFIPGSNDVSKYRDVQFHILNSVKDSVNMGFIRDGVESRKYVHTYYVRDSLMKFRHDTHSWYWISTNIAYVNMGELVTTEVDSMMTNINSSQGIIFDMRNYPKKTSSHILSYLISEPVTPVIGVIPDFTYPGKFQWINFYECDPQLDVKKCYKGEVVVLVNEWTQSQAEWAVMEFKSSPNCTVIGSQTAGSDGHISEIQFLSGDRTVISSVGVFYPDSTETQRIGIMPDLLVRPTVNGLSQGRDEVLERAIEFINKKV